MNALALEVNNDTTLTMTMPPDRLLRAYIKEARYECLRAFRNIGFSGPFLLLPVGLYLLFAVVLFGEAVRNDPKAGMGLFLAFSVMGVMGPAMFGFGLFVATEREQGLLTLKRALPAPPSAYLLAKILMAVLFAAIIMVGVSAAAVSLGHLRLSIAQFFSVAAVNVLGAAPFCAIGLFIGTRVSAKAAPALVNLLYLPMIYLSGFFFPMPKAIHWIQFLSPAYYLDQLAIRAIGGASQGPAILHVGVLTGVTLLLGGLAVRRLVRVG